LSSPPFTIDELQVPASMSDPDATDFAEMVDVRNAVEAASLGSDALSYGASELLPVFQAPEYTPRRLFVARVGRRIVGRGVLSWSTVHDTSVSRLVVEVLPELRRRGIGSALFDHLERLAMESGRPTLQAQAVHSRVTSGERVAAASGFGHLSTADPGVRFMQRRGYRLEQVKRISFLDLPVDPHRLLALRRSAQDAAGDAYHVVNWTGRTPRRWISDLALLKSRMSSDDPTAGLAVSEEVWDDARVVDRDEKQVASGREMLTVAVEHLPSGRLVGLSELTFSHDRTRPVRQEDTLVLTEHRGRRLGMLLKAANLLTLAGENPGSSLVYTFNAEENWPMLAINEQLGFRAVGYEGGWEKVTSSKAGR
jgi:GNAT superfamily N-acetyltransferase